MKKLCFVYFLAWGGDSDHPNLCFAFTEHVDFFFFHGMVFWGVMLGFLGTLFGEFYKKKITFFVYFSLTGFYTSLNSVHFEDLFYLCKDGHVSILIWF